MNETNATRSEGRHSPVPSGPVLRFDLAAEAEALRREPAFQEAGHNTKTLLRRPDLRLVLVTLRAGARLHEHKTDRAITVQTLSGHVVMHISDAQVDLTQGSMLALDGAIPHDVVAHEDSAILISISWSQNPAAAAK